MKTTITIEIELEVEVDPNNDFEFVEVTTSQKDLDHEIDFACSEEVQGKRVYDRLVEEASDY
jgi:hypothetical protein